MPFSTEGIDTTITCI